MSLKTSYHFVNAEDILNVQGITKFRDLYDLLSARQHSGGFFVKVDGHNNYVKAADFAATVLRRAVAEAILQRGLSDEEAASVQTRVAEITDSTVESLLREVIRELPVVPVHGEPATPAADEQHLQDRHDMVFEVHDGPEKVGWYLNHEGVRATTTTKTVFVCGNTPPHENPSADNGSCGYCPWAIVGSRKV